jgi:hypothetical protein
MFERLKLYAMAALAVLLSAFGIYAAGLWSGAHKRQARIDTDNLKALRKARQVEEEINAMDKDALRELARKWVRKR